jgi:hypothetical protein
MNDVTSCGKYAQRIISYVSCAVYITFPLISTTYPHRKRHHSQLHPLTMLRPKTGRGKLIPVTIAEFHIHIQNTNPDRDVMLSGIHV